MWMTGLGNKKRGRMWEKNFEYKCTEKRKYGRIQLSMLGNKYVNLKMNKLSQNAHRTKK